MDEKKTMFKAKALKYFFAFLIGMLVLTFVSRGIYTYQMPKISVTTLKNTTITHKIESSGVTVASNELPIVVLPELRISELYVKKGDILAKGDVLLKYDKEYLEDYIQKLNIEIEKDTLTRNDYYNAKAWNNAEIITYSIEDNQKKLKKYEQLLENDAEVHSEADGIITEVKVKAGDLTGDTASFMIADMSKNLYFTADISKDDTKLVSIGDVVTVSFRNGKIKMENCNIITIIPTDSEDVYKANVSLEDSEVTVGEVGQLSAEVISKEKYECVPITAVNEDDVQPYIYVVEINDGFLGEEYHVMKKFIEIKDKNEKYVALSDSGLNQEDNIVLNSNKKIYSGDVVRLFS